MYWRMSTQEDLTLVGFTREQSQILFTGFVRAGLCDGADGEPKNPLLYQKQLTALVYCLKVFGDSQKSVAWLCNGLQNLDKNCPIVLLASNEGISQLTERLVQIEFGFFA